MFRPLAQSGAHRLFLFCLCVAFFAVACMPDETNRAEQAAPAEERLSSTATRFAPAVPTPTASAAGEEAPATAAVTSPPASSVPVDGDEAVPRGLARSFTTDFSRRSIGFDEIRSGGPPKDGIPALDNPSFVDVAAAAEWLEPLEPVTVFENEGEVRIYPFQILTWHEIVNDVVGGRPVAVTFCPLCNTAIVFDATVDGRQLDFGTTGRLRYSNLLMYDRQSESWWQQATGEAVMGEFTGQRLALLPSAIISWAEARDTFPEAQVLSRDTGFRRSYGQNPYAGYDNINSSPFLFDGPSPPDRLPPMARVTTVALNGEAVAYPEQVLQEVVSANDTVGGVDIAVFWQPGLASALDQNSLAEGRDVGASAVFRRTLNGQTLTFVADGETIRDEQTGSSWNILGEAEAGALAGEQLAPVVKIDHFWFSWAAFRPDTRIYQP